VAVTIKDVAKHTGLSTATISKYINGGNVLEENRVRIEEAICALDFTVNEFARGLKTNKTMTVGVLIPAYDNIFCTSIVSCVENILMQYGYSTIVCDYRQDELLEASKLDFLLGRNVDGIIIMPLSSEGEHIRKALDKNIPVVLIDRPLLGVNCDTVLVDNLNASYLAVEQLITRGHRHIGIICGQKDVYTAQERLKGYLRVHEDYGMAVDETLVRFGDYQMDSGYRHMAALLEERSDLTAIFVTNYEMTLGAIVALNERNVKIPDELSLIGFDDLYLSKVIRPPLSIVVQPMQQIGETAANLLVKRLKGDTANFPAMFRLKTEVIMRESVRDLTSNTKVNRLT
jgi:LacI family transcriptional regulator